MSDIINILEKLNRYVSTLEGEKWKVCPSGLVRTDSENEHFVAAAGGFDNHGVASRAALIATCSPVNMRLLLNHINAGTANTINEEAFQAAKVALSEQFVYGQKDPLRAAIEAYLESCK